MSDDTETIDPPGYPLDDATAEMVKPHQWTVGDLQDIIKNSGITRDMPLILNMSHTSRNGQPDLAFTLFGICGIRTPDQNGLAITVESRELTLAEMYGADPDESREVTFAHANEVSDAIIGAYNGSCPDCGERIPNNVQDGDFCNNCEHVFRLPTPAHETTTEDDEE